MKSSKGKYKVLHIGRNNPKHQNRMRDDQLEGDSAAKHLGVLMGSKQDHKSAVYLCSREGQKHLVLHKENMFQQVKIKIIALHSALLRHAWRVVSTHGLRSTSAHMHPRMQSSGGRWLKDWSIWHGEPESTETPAWRKLQEILSVCINTWGGQGKQHFSVVPSNRVKGNGHKLKHIEFHLSKRKPFSTLWLFNCCCPSSKLFYLVRAGVGLDNFQIPFLTRYPMVLCGRDKRKENSSK